MKRWRRSGDPVHLLARSYHQENGGEPSTVFLSDLVITFDKVPPIDAEVIARQ